MSSLIRDLITDDTTVALTFRQLLEPVEGLDVPIFPPTYPPPEKGEHRFNTPYTVNPGPNDTLICDIDSVQSQANRMEAAFSDGLADVVPQHAVEAGDSGLRDVRFDPLTRERKNDGPPHHSSMAGRDLSRNRMAAVAIETVPGHDRRVQNRTRSRSRA